MEFMVDILGSLAMLFASSVIVAPFVLGLILLIRLIRKRKGP